eukprot:scaffold10687_cov121-Isochrysis_galbana.AAC.2
MPVARGCPQGAGCVQPQQGAAPGRFARAEDELFGGVPPSRPCGHDPVGWHCVRSFVCEGGIHRVRARPRANRRVPE